MEQRSLGCEKWVAALCKVEGRGQREVLYTNKMARVRQSCGSGGEEVEEKVDRQGLAQEFWSRWCMKFQVRKVGCSAL